MKPDRPSFQGKTGLKLSNRRSQARRRQRLRLLLLAGSAGLFLVALVMIVNYINMTRQTVKTGEELKAVYYQGTEAPHTEEPIIEAQALAPLPIVSYSPPPQLPEETPRPFYATQIPMQQAIVALTPEPAMAERFVTLYKRNQDVVGWLKLESVQEIDFPITKRDNSFYVNHDFYGRSNAAGSAFLDMSCSVLPGSENYIIHAHNMKNGTMFGKLNHLLSLDTLVQKPLASFDTLYEQGLYVPYAVSIVSIDPGDERYFPVIEPEFLSDDAKQAYVQQLVSFSAYALPIDVLMEDNLLTLVTCHGNEQDERLVVGYRKLRANEAAFEVEDNIRRGTVKL